MKRFFSILAIIGIIAVSNCSRIPENNDPILGAWVKLDPITSTAKDANTLISEEWIFNDVYLGRYQRYNGNNKVDFYTDFRWEVVDNVYTITYAQDAITPLQFELKQSVEDDLLKLINGELLAVRK